MPYKEGLQSSARGMVRKTHPMEANALVKQNLYNKKEQIRLLAKYTDDIVSFHDAEGTPHYCSPALERILGYFPNEAVGVNLFSLLHPDDADAGKRILSNLPNKNASLVYECRVRHKNGNYLWLKIKLQPELDENGEVLFIVAISRDITKQKVAEEELKLQKTLFGQLFASSQDGIVILDNTGRILNANESFRKLFLYSLDELIGMKLKNVVEASTSSSIDTRSINMETPWKRRDGQKLHISIQGKLAGDYVIFRDLTSKKNDEIAIKNLEVLLQEIHHRVKNNMRIICSLNNLQARQIKDKNILAIFKENQNRVSAMALIHDQLYKASDLGKLDFADYLRNLSHRLISSYGRTDIICTVNTEPLTLTVKQAVPCGLIVNELVTNSMKHAFKHGQPGRITVNLKKIEKDLALLEVSDNGTGLPDDFDINTTSHSMGMQLINGLTKQAKGKLTITTGELTTFSIKFSVI